MIRYSNTTSGGTRPCGTPLKESCAFTIVELLAATALAALLFTTALYVIRSIRPMPVVETGWTTALAAQLRWDIDSADVIRPDSKGLTLAGYGSLDPTTLEPTHVPVSVAYALHPVGGKIWLFREQTDIRPGSSAATFNEAVCGDVESFTVTAASPPQVAGEWSIPVVFRNLNGFMRLPDSVRFRVVAGKTAVDQTVFRR
jgi:hypothetical protein